ncbi:distal membrane-arm assembly complex protein 1 isoform 3 [Homo sapiens]|uniref:distal membrane-arm assembly complex protein 1 isoform 3 n=1 Tax=Homo sapiens TaxID=9606 RepID=UPI00073284FA|nr:distal membrane-arm assembly complex protein 1 isoform 3 [Homo sapiens]|eukprot:NP_001304988.1 distal membrane-arm assembly complex protein 1 isoform 3 [Homo sapiens]
MGSRLSQPFESYITAPPGTAAAPAKPAPPATPGAPTSPAEHRLLKTCWSCRVLSGLGLMGAGGHCHLGYRCHGRPQREGLPRCLKVPPVNLSSVSVPFPVTHTAGMEFNGCSGQTLVHGQTSLLWILQD